MKKLVFIFVLLISANSFCQEDDIDWRVIPSLTEWIEEINNSKDSVYVANDIKILVDYEKDSLIVHLQSDREKYEGKTKEIQLSVNKPIRLNRWYIENFFGTRQLTIIKNIRFEKEVYLRDMKMYGFAFENVIFDETLTFNSQNQRSWFRFNDCEFRKDLSFMNINEFSWIYLDDCILDEMFYTFQISGAPSIWFINTTVKEDLYLTSAKLKQFNIDSCKIETLYLKNAEVSTAGYLTNSTITNIDLEGALLPESNTYIPFDQISEKVGLYQRKRVKDSVVTNFYTARNSKDFNDKKSYDLLIASYKLLLKSYQNRGDMISYNACYVEMRDKETAYYKSILDTDPSFDNFLTYQLNVFLKAFSDYGTKPTKAITFSIYVILVFAFIYLLFPNSWDSLGRKRLMHRFEFFQKYLRRKEGMHTLYLEENAQEISSYEDFKTNLEKAHLELPSFFIKWSKPLYNVSMLSSKITSRFLQTTDVLKGKWTDLSPKQKRWKNIQIGFLLTLGLFYDLFIKLLNALMLSINTFTTLGFGEIPIKGLPRYLAIIQGFIGWFMLTIFSVSLISQLLN